DEAARQLDWPIGTLSGRLSRARKMLADRLVRRGLVVAGGSLAALLSLHGASAGAPSLLVAATVKAASAFAARQAATAEVISANVAGLTEGVLRAMFLTKLKIAAYLLLVVSSIGAGLGVGAAALLSEPQHAGQTETPKKPQLNVEAQAEQPAQARGGDRKRITPADIAQIDETKIIRVSATTDGRIERIHKATGERVKKGDVLAELYSPELMTTTQQFLNAQRSGNADLQRNVRERLRLWSLDNEQIEAILKAGKPVSHLTFRAPIDGYVIRKHGISGAYVKAGDPLYDLAELAAVTLKGDQPAPTATKNPRIQTLLEERRATLRLLVKSTTAAYHTGKATYAEVAQATSLLLKAELEFCTTDKERLALHEEAVALAKANEKSATQLYKVGKAMHASVLAATANRLEAEIALERAKVTINSRPK
ncbi:MAG: efflux RND transporter periplasmic adaptor subunit, partial [Gemmataceae bacterium]|nr:efflux RND transporter periplasmic adaptor subunit [Gemmataceae bacterium]